MYLILEMISTIADFFIENSKLPYLERVSRKYLSSLYLIVNINGSVYGNGSGNLIALRDVKNTFELIWHISIMMLIFCRNMCAESRQLVPINFGYADTHLTGAYSTAPVSTSSSSSSSSLSPSSFEQSTLGYIHTKRHCTPLNTRASERARMTGGEKGTTGWPSTRRDPGVTPASASVAGEELVG